MWWLLLLPCALGLRTLEPPPPVPVSRSQVVEGWLPVRLNHFDASDTNAFQMRYYYNPELRSSDPHVVIFVGGEWQISEGWVEGGLAHDLASRIGAGLFYTEHRYYGLTRPTSHTATEQLRWLNVDQALGDLAQFIQHVRSDDFEDGVYKNAKVALVGCSYAGSMATWMRLGYPHLITAAMSDSGPLHAQEDFPEYLEVITEALRVQGGESCVQTIEEAVEMMLELLTTPAGIQRVSDLFRCVNFTNPHWANASVNYVPIPSSSDFEEENRAQQLDIYGTCSLLQASSPLDLATFFWFGITETFAYLVQPASPGDIPAACAVITNTTLGDPVERLAAWITSQAWTQPCIESRYQEMVAAHTNTSYDAPDAIMRLWTYQTCAEYGWYQTTTSSRQPFGATVPLEYFHQMCVDLFPEIFTEDILRAGIDRTNRLFAGLSHLPDHVLSVAGGHDPWNPMGPNTTHATPLAPVYVVPEVSHCRAIRSVGASDNEDLERTKQEVLDQMVYLMTGEGVQSGAPALTATAMIIITALLLIK